MRSETEPTDLFDPVLFIKDGSSEALKKSSAFPFLYNRNGRGLQFEKPYGDKITMAPAAPRLDRGQKYTGIEHWTREVVSDSGFRYQITEFDFHTAEVHYQPLLATHENAQAFGMTLLKSGECVAFPYDNLIIADYTYGKWAGYESPYLGKGRGRELLVHNPTDLEYHDFPHVFFSRDDQPLVISVARWRPYVGEISLADLWVERGDALVLPPKLMPPAPQPGASDDHKWSLVLDLHGNRNSAQACRFVDGVPYLTTTTILANKEAFVAPATRPHYFEEKAPTRHYPLSR